MWSGLGGLIVSLLTFGVNIFVVSCECDLVARDVLAKAFSNHITFINTADLKAIYFHKLLLKKSF